jgi:hypothetical protein
MIDGRTERSMRSALLDLRSWHKGRVQVNPHPVSSMRNIRVQRKFYEQSREILQSALPGKVSKIIVKTPVPQTDTGELLEKSKANERDFVKELGKKAAVRSLYGLALIASLPLRNQLNSKIKIQKSKELFIQNFLWKILNFHSFCILHFAF